MLGTRAAGPNYSFTSRLQRRASLNQRENSQAVAHFTVRRKTFEKDQSSTDPSLFLALTAQMATTGAVLPLSSQTYCGFLTSAIEVALALIEVARITSDPEDASRYRTAAGSAYEMVAQLSSILRLEPADRQVLEEKLQNLRERLASQV